VKTVAHPSGDQHWTRRMPDKVLRGPDAPGAKLSQEQIKDMRWLQSIGWNKSEIARHMRVSRYTVWRHLKDV
jgi:predicted DNA-binding protein (UPF0251 family)